MSARTIIHSARIVSDGRVTDNGWVVFDADTISATGQGAPPALSEEGSTAEVIDAQGRYLSPGFIDIHCHGAGGAAFDDGEDAINTALALHRSHGTTRSVISLVTGELEAMQSRLAIIAEMAEGDPLVLGSHLEGPFLDVGHKGAHNPTLLRNPSPDAVAELIDAGRGHIKQITLAPELDGGMETVARFAASGVAVAVGHTDASYEQTMRAFDAGATILTHAFNAMNGIHHRAPGPVAAATHSPQVTLEIINDGVHVHPEVVRLVFEGAKDRVAMITDAMAAAGSNDGVYRLGSLDVIVTDGTARLADGGSIAGSTLTLDSALRRAVRFVGVPIETAVHALTQAPAHAIGRDHDLGRIARGYAADAVLLDDDLNVVRIWGAGQPLSPAS